MVKKSAGLSGLDARLRDAPWEARATGTPHRSLNTRPGQPIDPARLAALAHPGRLPVQPPDPAVAGASAIRTQPGRITQAQPVAHGLTVFAKAEGSDAIVDPDAPPGPARLLLAANMVRLRTARGWSQEALAFEAGLNRTFIGHVERCTRNISLDNIEKLASALGVETFELLRDPGLG